MSKPDNYMEKLALADISNDALSECERAVRLHGPFASAHEGYAVLLEEVDELWDEVKNRDKNKERMREEALQIAAMAIRFVHDVCDE